MSLKRFIPSTIPIYGGSQHGLVAINPKFDKLITLRTAMEKDEGTLDKEATS